jgi:hypothetical protein
MARGKRSGNKLKTIREFLAAHPDMLPKDVVAALKESGIKVSSNYVSTAKWYMRKTAAKGGRRPKTAAAKPAAASDAVSLTAMLEAKKLVQKLGGIAQAKEALGALAQLTG